jgi:phosphoribosylaminoimidazole-succinocarboxamide synthase
MGKIYDKIYSKDLEMKQEIYKGSKKILYSTPEEDTMILSFTDNIVLPNNKILEISGKGVINNSISTFIMQKLDMMGVENHFIKKLNMRQQVVKIVDIFPVEVSITNIACDRYVTDFKMEEGYVFDAPIIEFRVKNRELKYPVINEHQMINFGWLYESEIKEMKKIAIRVYDFLNGLFMGVGIRCVQCNLEFGRIFDGEDFSIVLADEISPDNCKLWDSRSNEKLGLEGAIHNKTHKLAPYKEIFDRLSVHTRDF